MRNICKVFFLLTVLCSIHFSAAAQNTPAANDLIKQGVALHNEGKYQEAIDKYNEVLKANPQNPYANYELAFSLYASNKLKDAVPYLETAIKYGDNPIITAAYSLLATYYDANNQPQKAIDTYKKVIEINPDYPQVYYNLGITYSRNQQYTEAENAAIEAIKHNPKNASSQRLYALVMFHQNKRVNALMGFCSFILVEPAGQRAAEAYGNIQHILQGGVLKDANGNTSISVSTKDDKETGTLNLGISLITQSGLSKKLTGADLLEYELKSIFTLAGQLSEKKMDKSFFDKFFVDYFYKLAQSNNMSAFTHTVALSDKTIDNAKWGKENMQQLNALGEWLKSTERSF